METSLHQRLKRHYANSEAEVECKVGRYRIDAIRGQELIEIQHASLSSIRRKVADLVTDHQLRVVKPLVLRKQLIRCAGKGQRVVSRRFSPKRGALLDIFDELIYFTRVFPHPNLVVEVPLIHVEEWSYPTPPSRKRRRRPPKKYTVEDQRLVDVVATHEFRTSKDLLALLPDGLPTPFDTADLAGALDIQRWVAQRITYCLRKMEAVRSVGKRGNAVLYEVGAQPRKRLA